MSSMKNIYDAIQEDLRNSNLYLETPEQMADCLEAIRRIASNGEM